MADQQPGPKRYTIAAAAKALGMSAKRIRAYCSVGFFPRPIREPGERGGFWYEEAISFMRWRRDHVHEFRLPPCIRDELDRLLPGNHRKKRAQRTEKKTDS